MILYLDLSTDRSRVLTVKNTQSNISSLWPVPTSQPRLVHRTARIRLRLTRHQADRCYRLLRSAGDIWAWLLDMQPAAGAARATRRSPAIRRCAGS